ncbi:MAG: BACON domain-containing protein [Akkermansia muciniphila]
MVADCPDWISASAVSGIGRTTVMLTAAENKSAAGRSGTVIFRSSDKQECSVTITQEGAELTGYDKWVQDSFPPDASADRTTVDAVPAGDGITNLMKYATGQDPLKPCGSVTKVTLEEGEDGCMHLVLRSPVNPQATDVKHEVEASTDLAESDFPGEVGTAGKTAAEFRNAEPVRESGMERRFLRLKVTRE